VHVASDGTQREGEICRYDDAGRKTKVQHLAVQQPNMEIAYAVEGTEHAYAAPGAATSTVVNAGRVGADGTELPRVRRGSTVSVNSRGEAWPAKLAVARPPDL
jgi:hypothetical protein